MNWLRFFCWMDFDITTGSSTCVVFRYPIELKARFLADFDGPRTAVLEQYPVMMHASMLERINTMTREIHFSLCDPMYSLVSTTVSKPSAVHADAHPRRKNWVLLRPRLPGCIR